MRKFLLTAFLGMSALIVNVQQWSGSTTATDTIYRDGMVRMMPNSAGVPFSEWTPGCIFVSNIQFLRSKDV